MALKTLMLRKKLDGLTKSMAELRAKEDEFAKREAELESAIAEAETEEETSAVEEAVETLENDKAENNEAIGNLAEEITKIESEIAESEEKQEQSRSKANTETPETRKVVNTMDINKRTKFFGMTVQERDAFINESSVQELLANVRAIGRHEERAVSGADLTIPDTMLGLIRENIENYSKLMAKADKRTIKGTSRLNIAGGIPEAVWTEACAKLNELSLKFYQTELEGYKVGGYIAICNATLEDSDLNLASEIINAIGKAIGYALDKALIYGTGTKMPLGFVTRLAQTAKPSGYPINDRTWVDLHTSNIVTIASSAKEKTLYQELILASGKVSDKYATKDLVWIMNKKTKNYLTAQALNFNSNGVLVSGQNDTMPIVGGDIITLDFIPDNNIAVGFLENYILVERSGTKLESSKEFKFLDDQTVFKGTARYDGKPVIAEAFALIGIAGTTPTTSVTFAQDTANSD